MTSATERITEFLRQFRHLKDTDGVIHQVHTDPDAEQATLTVTDLALAWVETYREGVADERMAEALDADEAPARVNPWSER